MPGSHLQRFQCNRPGGALGIGIHKHLQRFYQAAGNSITGLEGSGLHMHLYDPLHHLIKAGEQGTPYPPRWALLISNPPAKKDPNIYPLFHRAPWRCFLDTVTPLTGPLEGHLKDRSASHVSTDPSVAWVFWHQSSNPQSEAKYPFPFESDCFFCICDFLHFLILNCPLRLSLPSVCTCAYVWVGDSEFVSATHVYLQLKIIFHFSFSVFRFTSSCFYCS